MNIEARTVTTIRKIIKADAAAAAAAVPVLVLVTFISGSMNNRIHNDGKLP